MNGFTVWVEAICSVSMIKWQAGGGGHLPKLNFLNKDILLKQFMQNTENWSQGLCCCVVACSSVYVARVEPSIFILSHINTRSTNITALGYFTLADLGGARPARPPQGSQFFRFDIQNFRNVTASGVHTPSYEVHAPPPPTGNPGSATVSLNL